MIRAGLYVPMNGREIFFPTKGEAIYTDNGERPPVDQWRASLLKAMRVMRSVAPRVSFVVPNRDEVK